ncbi:hypothetical protein HanXRQr2_Chr09g0397171 [Helianthus annuus]|uniref:Uncharacterized protein n=1 Tax=Helianthus annuus TaxID=4232 RepID=A0A251S3D1_HELAN|nr:hypothetical protein HanXRQr2_Chr09g0397171 [Helianthus annuus]KAJ0535198.1 hypothetical protein HanIR_Chr09g0428091 [Helianthus annuus]KAJ0893894.1 hypothetical protein HanPSC8_Chr09g0382931 [Helianthus annuus]
MSSDMHKNYDVLTAITLFSWRTILSDSLLDFILCLALNLQIGSRSCIVAPTPLDVSGRAAPTGSSSCYFL